MVENLSVLGSPISQVDQKTFAGLVHSSQYSGIRVVEVEGRLGSGSRRRTGEYCNVVCHRSDCTANHGLDGGIGERGMHPRARGISVKEFQAHSHRGSLRCKIL